MSIFNNNNIHNKKNYTDSEKNLFSLPNNNTYNGHQHSIKKINDNMNLKISPSNKKEIMNNNISLRTQILSNHENNSSKIIQNYINCKRHPKNIISYFCESDKTFPCSICIEAHFEHNYMQFFCTEEIFSKEINKIKKIFNEVELKYSQNKKNSEKFFLNVKNHFDEQIHKINDYFDSLISVLQDKKSIFISKILKIYENYIKELVKYNAVFDFCDKSYSSLYQKILYIENELYKKRDYELFFNIKDNIINDINNFSVYNDENFYNNKFNYNPTTMPRFIPPKKQIITTNDSDNLYGYFENTNFHNEEKKTNKNIENKNNIRYSSLQNKNNKIENNILFDSIAGNSTLKKENNKNKNIFSSINSNISNINDSFIEKQLIETNSTLFLFNKNEVKNVFKQQDLDVSQNFNENKEEKEEKANNNINSNSPKIDNKICKTKYTSCNKEKRNKQIIKKFLENEDINRNNISDIGINQLNIINEDKIYLNSNNNITNLENIKSIDDENNIKIKNINNIKRNSLKVKEFHQSIGNKNTNIERKRSGSMNKNNKNYRINHSCQNSNKKRIYSKEKKHHLKKKKKKINNINRYFENSYGEENNRFSNNNNKINLYSGYNKNFINSNNSNNYILKKNSMSNMNKKKINTYKFDL